jgi:hypothetical protein
VPESIFDLRERLAKLEQRVASHEVHCDERHSENQDRLVALEKYMIRLVVGVGASVIVGLITLVVNLVHNGGKL